MSVLYDQIKAQDSKVVVSDKSWKFKFEGKMMQEPMEPDEELKQDLDEETKEEPVQQSIEPVVLASAQIAVELHEIKDGEQYVVSFTRKAGSNMAFQKVYDDLHENFIN